MHEFRSTDVATSVANIRQLAPYVLAFVILVGSGLLLFVVDEKRFEQLLPFVTAIDGAVVAYVFAKEQTQVVQSGNGLERRSLDAIHRRLDAELPAIREATHATAEHATETSAAADAEAAAQWRS